MNPFHIDLEALGQKSVWLAHFTLGPFMLAFKDKEHFDMAVMLKKGPMAS